MLQQYPTTFKGLGIPEDELMQIYDLVEKTTNSITPMSDVTEKKKEAILENMADTKQFIDTAYHTKTEAEK